MIQKDEYTTQDAHINNADIGIKHCRKLCFPSVCFIKIHLVVSNPGKLSWPMTSVNMLVKSLILRLLVLSHYFQALLKTYWCSFCILQVESKNNEQPSHWTESVQYRFVSQCDYSKSIWSTNTKMEMVKTLILTFHNETNQYICT